MSQCLSLAAAEAAPDFEHVSVLFAGAATVVLRYGGFTVVVDPAFVHHGDHVHLGYDLSASGASELASVLERLPPVDFVLVPHLEDGHQGRRVDRELDRRVPLLTTRAASSTLRRKGFVAARGVGGWETTRVEREDAAVHVTSVPAQRPVSFESFLPDAIGAVLEFAGPGDAVQLRAFVPGDDALHADLRELPLRPGVDLALIPVGGRRVLGVLAARDGRIDSVCLVAPRARLSLTGDGRGDEPLEDFAAAVRRTGTDARVEYVEAGEEHVLRMSALRGFSADAAIVPADDAVDEVAAGGDRTVAA
jgi:L-ascorbate metabolism protein UlaG (beta-lactamase superfamily)